MDKKEWKKHPRLLILHLKYISGLQRYDDKEWKKQ